MTRTVFNIRAAAIYLILVGAPFTSLVAILHAGNQISAPLSVKGKWNLEASREEASGTPGADLLTAMRQQGLTISQSGIHLGLTIQDVGKTTLTGDLHGNTLTATGEMPSTDIASLEEGTKIIVSLSATIDSESRPLSMRGRLTIQGQPEEFQPVLFKAIGPEDSQHMRGAH